MTAIASVFTATFTFASGVLDEEFHRLDQVIAEAAKALPGYLGEEAWESAAKGQVLNVYYWSSLEALMQLIEHPAHLQVKKRQVEWLNGYHVVIGQVLRSYGDGRIHHPLAPARETTGHTP